MNLASEKLGYHEWSRIVGEENSKNKDNNRLADALISLSIEPLDPSSVEKYKKAKLRKANRFLEAWRFLNSEVAFWIFLASTFIGVVSLSIEGWYVGSELFSHAKLMAWQWWMIPLSFSLVCLGILSVPNRFEVFSWNHDWLDNYRKPVPAFALSRALELKEKLPAVKFMVHHFSSVEEFRDPFLVAYLGNELAYLDVWDEPSFEGRRVI